MAITKRSNPQATKRPQSTAAQQAKQAVQELREFYKLGQKVLKKDRKNPLKRKYSWGVTVEIAKEIGMARDYVDKSRKFASTYTKAEFEELCRLRRPDGIPLGPRHVIGLLRIKNKRQRERLQRRAAIEGWSTRRIPLEVSKLLGTAGSGGRRPKSPQVIDDALMQVLTMTKRWGRWYEGFDSKKRKEKDLEKSRIEVEDLPDSVRKHLKSVSGQIQKLKDAVKEELKLTSNEPRKR